MNDRDEFAKSALAGVLAADVEATLKSVQQAAEFAYKMADAMLAERERTTAKAPPPEPQDPRRLAEREAARRDMLRFGSSRG